MQLELLQENLSYALNLVSRIIVSKPQLPILSHVLLSARNGKLTLTASNQEITILVEVGAKVTKEGEFTLPGRTFLEIVTSLSAEKISLNLEGTMMALVAGSFKASINGTPATEFPSVVPQGVPKTIWEMDATAFTNLVAKTVFAAAADESRATLTGVLFKPADGQIITAATDGFRLSVLSLPQLGKELESGLIIPAKTLLEVVRVVSDTKQDLPKVKISLLPEANQILFDLDKIKIYSATIAGNFPTFEKIIPTSSQLLLSLDAGEFLKAIRLASVFARESANIVKLKTGGSKLTISANAPQIGENESEIEVKSKEKSEELAIAFNFHYLLDFLNSIGNTGEITLELSGPTSPGVFKITSDPDFLHLIMPVRVQN